MGSLMIIMDGAQDIGYPQLGGLTPLEAGKGDAYRAIESAAATVRMSTTPPGFEPDTLICMLTLLGIGPDGMPTGRSSLEAMAEGVEVGRDDLILRCNFVKISEDGKLEVPCCEAPEEVARALMEEVGAEYGRPLRRIGPYKCLQTVAGERKSAAGIKTFPPHNYMGGAIEELLPQGNALAGRLAETTRRLYRKYRPYTVLNWAPSVYEEVPAFRELHGFGAGMVTKTLVLEGIARRMGLDCPAQDGCTGDTDTDLPAKAGAALELLGRNELVVVHIGGTDEATHRRDPEEKARFISRIDRQLLAPILSGVPDGTRIMLTCDHAALCSTAGHTPEPVSALLFEKGKVCRGDLGLREGVDAVKLVCGGSWTK